MKKSDKSNNMFKPRHAEYLYIGVDENGELQEVSYQAKARHLVAMAGVALEQAARQLGGNFSDNVRKISDITIEAEKIN